MKLKKQKQELKKTLKKEEKRLESEENKTLIESKGESKNSDESKKGKLQELKSKAKIMLLRVLKYIFQILESFVLFLISVFGTLGLFIILVVIVLMIAIYGLLHIDFNIPSGDVISSKSDCIQGSAYLEESSWSELNIGNLSGALTEYQKNLYKTFTLVDEFLKGDGTNKPIMKDLPYDVAFRVFRGIPAVESSFYIFGYNDTSHDVLKDMTDSSEDNGKKPYLGPHQVARDSYINNPGYLYTSNYSGSSFISSWMQKYPKPNSSVKDHYWMPYSVGLSILHTYNMGSYANLNPGHTSQKYEEFKSYTEAVMDHFGIQANREECFQYIRALMSVASYLQGQSVAYLNYDYSVSSNGSTGGGKARIEYLCAVFAASSDEDSKRSFNNYAVILNAESKYKYAEGEGSLREWLIGSQGYGSYISDIGTLDIGTGKNPRISVEGSPINVPLIKYIYDKYKDDTFMENTWVHIKNSKGQYLSSYHYGLACLFQGNHIVQEMGLSMPISSGGNPDDCDCYEGKSGGSLDVINISSITVGQAQGPWDADLLEKINKRTSTVITGGGGLFKDHYGKTFIGSSNFAKAEDWRVKSKWKVPYYYQSNTAEIYFRSNGLRYHSNYGSLNACGTYMLGYLMSASTGKMINPIEAFAVGLELGVFQSNGNMEYTQSNFDKLNKYGINITTFSGDSGTTSKEKVDECLEKGGLVGLRSQDSSNIFVGSEHFFVITEKVGDKYNVYSATGFDRDTTKSYTWNEVTKGAVRFFLVSDINRGANNFTNYLFIGDSFTNGLNTNVDLIGKGHQVKAVTGESPSYWLNDSQFNTLPDSVNGVVVLLGVNNTSETTEMQDLLIKLVNKYNKTVYVQKVFPVGSSYSNFTEMNEKINIFNNTIKTFCESNNNLKFIDTTTGLVTSDGLLENADSMGVHLSSKEQYEKWWTNIETQLNKGSTQNVNTDCVSNSGGKASSVGALDLDLDVIDKVDYAAPNRNLFSQNYMSKEDVEFIVVHYWGSSNSGRSLGSSLVNGYHNASYSNGMTQYVVGVEGAYRTTPDLFIAPHCGGDTHTTERNPAWGTLNCRNKNSIGIEVGNSYVNGKYVYERDAIIHTVGLVKALMIEYNVDVDHVYRHYDCTLKVCPSPFVDDEYNSFNNPSAKSLDYDMGQSQNWVAFKKALQSDTIDWGLFNDYIIDNMSE